jgi:DHA1 family inner membrane transport protein
LGTAVGTAITSMALESSLGSLAPAIVGTIFALLTFVPLTALAIIDR